MYVAEQHRAVHPHTSAPHHAPQAHTVSLFSQGATTTQHQPDEGPQPHNTNPTSSSNLAQLNLYLFQLCPIDRSAGRVSPLTWVPLAPYLPPSVESIHSPAIQIDIKQEYWLATWVSYLPPCLPPGYHTFPPVPAQTAEPYRAVACPALPANSFHPSGLACRPLLHAHPTRCCCCCVTRGAERRPDPRQRPRQGTWDEARPAHRVRGIRPGHTQGMG